MIVLAQLWLHFCLHGLVALKLTLYIFSMELIRQRNCVNFNLRNVRLCVGPIHLLSANLTPNSRKNYLNVFINKCLNPPRQNIVILVMVSGRKAWLLYLFHDPLQKCSKLFENLAWYRTIHRDTLVHVKHSGNFNFQEVKIP